ncbi:MAG: hypothetical protein IJA22_01355 [Clostridia bacterium]|nr:hypothetical protein [Clostridia bacterium]
MKKIGLNFWHTFSNFILLCIIDIVVIEVPLYHGLASGEKDTTLAWVIVIASTCLICTIIGLILITYYKNRTIIFDENNNIKVKTLFTKNSFEINCKEIVDYECNRPRTLTKTLGTKIYTNEDFDDHILIKTADNTYKFYTSLLTERQILDILNEIQKRSGLKNKEITQKSIKQENKFLIK